MSIEPTTRLLTFLEPSLCLFVLVVIAARKVIRDYRFLAGFLAVRCVSFLILLSLLRPRAFGFSIGEAYRAYFFIYWLTFACEAVLELGMIVSLFQLAMAPLEGLQRLGMIMFRWACVISVAVSLSFALGPHSAESIFLVRATTQMQQSESVLILCLLLFVTLAIRPMGLSYRSRIFGVTLGLGITAATDLALSSWLPKQHEMLATVSLLNGISICAAITVWGIYFAIPEPKRRLIMLPTTSPFLRWNQISMVLGDEPGFVALGQVTSDMFAPAELEIMRRASKKIARTNSY